MKKQRRLLILLLALAALCCVAAVAGTFFYTSQRQQAIAQRPLVIIHAPSNRDQVTVGRGLSLHATARVETGVSRLELWVDDELVATTEAPEEEPVSPLVLVTTWEPMASGMHTIIARAAGEGGTSGQAAVAIEAIPEAAGIEGADGDTDDGTGDEAGEETGGGMDDDAGDDAEDDTGGGTGEDEGDTGDDTGDGSGGGDDGEEEDATDAGVPGDAAPPPEQRAPAPGSTFELLRIFGLNLDTLGIGSMEEAHLQLELLGLDTRVDYESLHCYVGVAAIDPRWYPDEDFDQSTDESFAYLGDGAWDVAEAFSGQAIPPVTWPGDQPLPIHITCVGMSGGGTDALDLGQLEINARPEAWDGVTRRAACEGEGGAFTVDYRVSQVASPSTQAEKWIDPSVTPPSDLRLIRAAGGNYWLGWEHTPEEDEDPIDGFSVYLNDTLQWIESPDSHFTALPSQWVHPPCGDSYRLYVRAWHDQGCPDCRESEDSNVVTTFTGEPGDPDCGRTVIVTFHTLTTGDLGGDGRYDPGDVGPVYGNFYVNEQLSSFDGRCDRNRCEWGIAHHRTYDVRTLLADHGSGSAQLAVDIPPEDDYVQLGFIITDDDSGRNNADDLVCRGEVLLDVNLATEGTIETDWPRNAPLNRCRVAYTLHPVSTAPVGEPGGPTPLPYLQVERMSVHDASGQLRIHVRNVGEAAWPRRDLEVEIVRPSGESLGIYTWPELVLDPGERAILQQGSGLFERPMDTCVILDPNNRVAEWGEDAGETALRYCPPLPDLTITNTEYDPAADQLEVTVENVGEASMERRRISLVVTLADGSTLSDRPVLLSEMTLERRHPTTLVLNGIGDAQRTRMWDGYTVTVDPIDAIGEADEGNNDYVVPAGSRIRLAWTQFTTRYYPRSSRSNDPQEQTVRTNISVGHRTGYAAEQTLGPFEVEGEMSGGEWEGMRPGPQIFGVMDEVEFDVAGDEWLTVFANNTMTYRLSERYLSWGAIAFNVEEDWGVGRTISEDEQCGGPGWTNYTHQTLSIQPPEPWQNCGRWDLRFLICRVE